jgi:hypothetical protein
VFRFRREPSDGGEEEHRCWWSSMIWLPGSVFAHEGICQGQPLADRMDIASLALQPSSPTSTCVPPLVGGCLPTRLAPLHLTRTRAKGGGWPSYAANPERRVVRTGTLRVLLHATDTSPSFRGILHIRNTPKRVSSTGALSAAEIERASTIRVSAGSIMPSSQSRALA